LSSTFLGDFVQKAKIARRAKPEKAKEEKEEEEEEEEEKPRNARTHTRARRRGKKIGKCKEERANAEPRTSLFGTTDANPARERKSNSWTCNPKIKTLPVEAAKQTEGQSLGRTEKQDWVLPAGRKSGDQRGLKVAFTKCR
jgi:hypothetical protein